MGAQKAAWRAAFHAETAKHSGMAHVQALIDLTKAFEAIPHRQLVVALRAGGVLFQDQEPAEELGEHPLRGKNVVVTGTLASMGRDEAKQRILAVGGKSAGSVSAKTDFLVAGENSGSKLNRANKLGVPVLNEEEFLSVLDGADPEGAEQQAGDAAGQLELL